jgi:FkbM family methyltransferase
MELIKQRPKMLWHSNDPQSDTGYGVETALFAPRIRDAGWDIVLSCMGGGYGPHEWEGITCLPPGMTPFSTDILASHAVHHFGRDPGLVLVHYDAWAIGPEAVAGLACAAWSPVHSHGMSRGDKLFYRLSGAYPISYSLHGVRMMQAAGLEPAYVPHGVDTSLFRPQSPEERQAARERFGISPETFVVGMVAANKGTDPPRKAWGEVMAAFAAFHDRHPDSLLFAHTLAATPDGYGLDLRPLIRHYGLGDAVLFSDDYGQVANFYTQGYVSRITGLADVFLNPSYGEGFGLGPVQAQACGVPVIVGDNSAQTELCGSGWLVDCQPYWHPRDEANWYVPFIASIEKALEKAYRVSRQPAQRDKLARRARAFAEGYDADLVMNTYWKPALEMLEQLCGAALVRPPAKAAVPLPTVESDGLRWLARGPHTDDWISVGHEDTLAPVLAALFPSDGVLLDVGAHVGRWALRLAGRASQVIAVEAMPDTAASLRYHIALNGIENVAVMEVAAWDVPDKLIMADKNRRVTGGSTKAFERDEVPDGEGVQVEAIPLDALLDEVERIDLVKLDVEGADLKALWGMRETLARLRPVLFIEDHSIYGYYTQAELYDLLEELGYDVQPFTAHLAGDRVAPYAIARPKAEV